MTVADDNRSQAKAKAQTWKKKAGTVVTKSDVESWVSSKQAAGKENPNVTGYLERQLGQGASLGSAVVNKYNRGKYDRPTGFGLTVESMQRSPLGQATYGIPSANIAGLSGLKLSKGQVYAGAARVGDSQTAPIVLPRYLMQSLRKPTETAPTTSTTPTTTDTPVAPASAQPREELSGKLLSEVPQFAPKYLPGTAESRQQARRESLDLASQASQKDVVSRGQLGIRDFYTKQFAQHGNSPYVFGMKDLQHMESTGASGDEIRRTALTIGSIGPQARKRISSKYGISL